MSIRIIIKITRPAFSQCHLIESSNMYLKFKILIYIHLLYIILDSEIN